MMIINSLIALCCILSDDCYPLSPVCCLIPASSISRLLHQIDVTAVSKGKGKGKAKEAPMDSKQAW
jgi:hypothetical protein